MNIDNIRKVYEINTGNLSPEEAKQILERLLKRIKQERAFKDAMKEIWKH